MFSAFATKPGCLTVLNPTLNSAEINKNITFVKYIFFVLNSQLFRRLLTYAKNDYSRCRDPLPFDKVMLTCAKIFNIILRLIDVFKPFEPSLRGIINLQIRGSV